MSRVPWHEATFQSLFRCIRRVLKQWLNTKTNRVYSNVEPKIKPLVDELNATGSIRTIASCQGHFHGKPPYVYFETTVEIASAIELCLRESAISCNPKLRTNWVVYGLFNNELELTFLLHSPDYHASSTHMFLPIWLFGLMRSKLDEELLMLASVVGQAVLLKVRDNNKPKITATSDYDKNTKQPDETQ